MSIFYNINIEEIKRLTLKKAKYQKVVCLYDSSTDLNLLAEIESGLKKECVLFSINLDQAENVKEMINDGARCVLWLVDDYNLMKYNQYVENVFEIFVLQKGSLLLRLKKSSSVFVSKDYRLSNFDKLVIYDNLVGLKWDSLLSSRNYGEEEKILAKVDECFKNVDIQKSVEFLLGLPECLRKIDCDSFANLKDSDFCTYLYYKIMAYKFLFLGFATQNEFMVDVYKEYETDYDNLDLSYKIFMDERMKFALKNCAVFMLTFIEKVFNLIDFHCLNNKLSVLDVNKILINLKSNAKTIKSDNLLKCSFLYGVFNAI